MNTNKFTSNETIYDIVIQKLESSALLSLCQYGTCYLQAISGLNRIPNHQSVKTYFFIDYYKIFFNF